MTRLINDHALRRVTSPSPLWTLSAPDLPFFAPVHTCVPADAQTVPGLEGYKGRLVYEKKITCAGTLRFLLHGTDGHARMMLDGRIIGEGRHIDAMVTDLPYEPHMLMIETEGGHGLIRPVTIEQMGGAYISRMQLDTHRQGRMWLCNVTVTITSLSGQDLPFELEISAGPARTKWEDQLLPAGASLTLKRTIPAPGVKRWSPKNPQLYAASCVLWLDGEPADDLRDQFGFRTAEWNNGCVTVNQKVIEGSILHRDNHCGLTGYAVPVSAAVRDVQLLLAMGCAAVRTDDDRQFLDACDALGLCVIAGEQIGNHPCIIVAPDAAALNLQRFADTDRYTDGLLDAFRNNK